MGLYDRDYTRQGWRASYQYAPQMRFGLPRMTAGVKWLLIINIAVFFAQISGGERILVTWFSVLPTSASAMVQVWRLITYQFLYGGIGHLMMNMIGLYFLGPTLERHYGTKRFVAFYLGCGAAGGLFYILLVLLGFLAAGPMVGASGAILGMLAACAILFPHFIVFFFLFPVPIRVAAIVLIVLYTANVLTRGANAGGDAAHLAGMAAGAIYVFSQSWRDGLRLKFKAGGWQRKMARQRQLQAEVDRILQKVHDCGIHNLRSKEKRILRDATKAEKIRKGY